MSVIPQQPRPTTADGVATSVLMTFRVLESGVDGTLMEHAISITAHVDGLIEACEHDNLIHTTHGVFSEAASSNGNRVHQWNTKDGPLLLRVLMGPSGEVTAHRSRIPELLGLRAGTYVLREIHGMSNGTPIPTEVPPGQ